MNKIYIGFVKDNRDDQNMGRIRVWIPELCGDPTIEESWFLVRYASPFAGATSVYKNTNNTNWQDTQRSYGMWFVPPDTDNEVLVCFINGDPGRGVWFACLYQQNMNHMVPGIPGNNSGNSTPVVEYNKLQKDVDPNNPTRPAYSPLADQLVEQGLDKDDIRGTSSSGARRSNPSSVYGLLTPGGSQMVFDDGDPTGSEPGNKFIRFRTERGVQILLNDNTGEIYMITDSGNNWFRMGSDGTVDIYGAEDINIRSEKSLNLRADLDVNIEAGRNMYVKVRGDSTADATTDGGGILQMNANAEVHLSSFGDFFISSNGEMHRTSDASLYDYSKSGSHYKSAGAVHIQSDGADIDMKAKGEIHETATNIHFNGPPPTDATAATAATAPTEFSILDNAIVDGKRQQITRTSILYNMPYHEPYDHSISTKSGSLDNNVSETDVKTDPSIQLTRKGEIIPNQQKPTNINGTPRKGMDEGIYEGVGFDANGIPQYKKVSDLTDAAAASTYTTSESGKSFLKRTEGIFWIISPDPPKQSTTYGIGYGHQLSKEELNGRYVTINGEKTTLEKGITRPQAEALFSQDVKTRGEDIVKKGITARITQAQFDALVSFAYNTGKMSGTDLAKAINNGNFEDVPYGFMQYTKSGGTTNSNLVKRRRQEAQWFLTGTKPPTG